MNIVVPGLGEFRMSFLSPADSYWVTILRESIAAAKNLLATFEEGKRNSRGSSGNLEFQVEY